MKRFVLLLLVVVFLPAHGAYGQMTVIAPALESLFASSTVSQIIYYAESISELVTTAANAVAMVENMIKQVEMAANNLSNVGDIRSFKDFKDWYNRQLYLEKKTEDTFSNMSVSIGKKSYKLADIEGIASGVNSSIEWDEEFTEEQKKDMWLRLGLTPSNYAYVQTWEEKEKNLARRFLAAPDIKNEEYMDDMRRADELLNALARDASLPDDEKMGDKGIAAISAEMAILNNKALNDIAMKLAEMQELEAVKMYRDSTPVDQPAVSEGFDEVYFKKLK